MTVIQLLEEAVNISPEIGSTKYMLLGQVTQGHDAIRNFTKGIQMMLKAKLRVEQGKASQFHLLSNVHQEEGDVDMLRSQIAAGYCSIAELYMTDCWYCHRILALMLSSDDANAESECERHCMLALE